MCVALTAAQTIWESSMLQVLASIINADKLGGWVRAGVASLLGVFIAKWPLLGTILDPATQAALGTVVAAIVVGVWSQLTKSDAAKVAMVDALAKDPASPVKGVILESTIAGQNMAKTLPGKTTVVAGTFDASTLARSNGGA